MRCLVTGGGTGGHIYPAIAVAEALAELLPRSKVLYVGTAEGMESALVPKEGLDFEAIRSSGIRGKSLFSALKGVWAASLGMGDARRIIKSFRPDVVLGTGGYVSGPVVLAASLMGVPCAIQEQNAVPGKTNLLLSMMANRTFAAWEYSLKLFPGKADVKVTGNPIRAGILGNTKDEARAAFGLRDEFTLLVLGGSRGARFLVDIAVEMAVSGNLGIQMLLITGHDYYENAIASLSTKQQTGIVGAKYGNIILRPYVYNMEKAYQACDMVLGRAGGMTLAEITALGLPSVIVPSPNVVGNHQEYNARALEVAGAAVVVREGAATFDSVERSLMDIMNDPGRHRKMAQAASKIGRPDAAKQIARELIALARRG
ncbi:MAG TPA: undecaprenyldiphospho-muramoylpentapeptide beta-N-acetylglucosaminyltransferase [Firmicutes bacterium]|nr:undecaprenyldiphospho-muramoylpentapeptide beta-N-acetylglucosaminyltransferase [Candidatus Fermentithermobacillaceae bacterium]